MKTRPVLSITPSDDDSDFMLMALEMMSTQSEADVRRRKESQESELREAAREQCSMLMQRRQAVRRALKIVEGQTRRRLPAKARRAVPAQRFTRRAAARTRELSRRLATLSSEINFLSGASAPITLSPGLDD